MANHRSARKRIRQNRKRAAICRDRRSRVRGFVRKAEVAIRGGNPDEVQEAMRTLQPELDRAVSKGVLHRNAASRKLSRLVLHARRVVASPQT